MAPRPHERGEIESAQKAPEPGSPHAQPTATKTVKSASTPASGVRTNARARSRIAPSRQTQPEDRATMT